MRPEAAPPVIVSMEEYKNMRTIVTSSRSFDISVVDDSSLDTDSQKNSSVGFADDDDHDDATDRDNHSVSDASATSADTSAFATGRFTFTSRFTRRLRQVIVVLFVYLVFIIPLIVYITTRSQEVHRFESEFLALSSKVIDSFALKLVQVLTSVDSLSIEATSYSIDINATWPNVTLLDFDLVGSSIADLAQTALISFNPLIPSQKQRSEWEAFVQNDIDWLWTAYNRQEHALAKTSRRSRTRSLQTPPQPPVNSSSNTTFISPSQQQQQQQQQQQFVPPNTSRGYAQQIWRFENGFGEVIDNSTGPYFPSWQMYPVDPGAVNWNWQTLPVNADALQQMMAHNQTVLSRLLNFSTAGQPGEQILTSYYTSLLQRQTGNANASYDGQPIAALYYPVFDTFGANTTNRKLVASISSIIFWVAFFEGMLPPNSYGIVCVMNNTCGDVFTIEVNGEGSYFVGYGDFHQGDYNYVAQTFHVSQLYQDQSLTKWMTATANPLDMAYCPYSLSVYPTKQLHDATVNNTPVIYAFVVMGTLILVSFISMTYDCVLQRRMRRVLKAAKQNRALVR